MYKDKLWLVEYKILEDHKLENFKNSNEVQTNAWKIALHYIESYKDMVEFLLNNQ